MTKQEMLELGVRRMGVLSAPDGASQPAFLEFEESGVTISVPELSEGLDSLVRSLQPGDDPWASHQSLAFQDTCGDLLLTELVALGSDASSNGSALRRIRAHRVISGAAPGADYACVNGMRSVVDGLAFWTGQSAVQETSIPPEGGFGRAGRNLRVQDKASLHLVDGEPHAQVDTSYSTALRVAGQTRTIGDAAHFTTRSCGDMSWREHTSFHVFMQDLMCLVYGRPVSMTLQAVVRDDDQPSHIDVTGTARVWRDAFEPSHGRGSASLRELDPRSRDRPLFHYSDIDPTRLGSLLRHREVWRRPLSILTSTWYQEGSTVEAHLVQVGVALEALGYALWKEDGGDGTAPRFPPLLERVTDEVSVESGGPFGNREASAWREFFNECFKGVKHADNDLPDPVHAQECVRSGRALVRAWLATRLGVPRETTVDGFDRNGR